MHPVKQFFIVLIILSHWFCHLLIMLFIKRELIMLWAVLFTPAIFNSPPIVRNRESCEREREREIPCYSPPTPVLLFTPLPSPASCTSSAANIEQEMLRAQTDGLMLSALPHLSLGPCCQKPLSLFNSSWFSSFVLTKVWLEDRHRIFFHPSYQSMADVFFALTLSLCAHCSCLFCL